MFGQGNKILPRPFEGWPTNFGPSTVEQLFIVIAILLNQVHSRKRSAGDCVAL